MNDTKVNITSLYLSWAPPKLDNNYVAEVYDYIMLANLVAEKEDAKNGWGSSESEWKIVRRGLDWFRRHFAKEYMVLLD